MFAPEAFGLRGLSGSDQVYATYRALINTGKREAAAGHRDNALYYYNQALNMRQVNTYLDPAMLQDLGTMLSGDQDRLDEYQRQVQLKQTGYKNSKPEDPNKAYWEGFNEGLGESWGNLKNKLANLSVTGKIIGAVAVGGVVLYFFGDFIKAGGKLTRKVTG